MLFKRVKIEKKKSLHSYVNTGVQVQLFTGMMKYASDSECVRWRTNFKGIGGQCRCRKLTGQIRNKQLVICIDLITMIKYEEQRINFLNSGISLSKFNTSRCLRAQDRASRRDKQGPG
jgi:hypothetical protein